MLSHTSIPPSSISRRKKPVELQIGILMEPNAHVLNEQDSVSTPAFNAPSDRLGMYSNTSDCVFLKRWGLERKYRWTKMLETLTDPWTGVLEITSFRDSKFRRSILLGRLKAHRKTSGHQLHTTWRME